MLRDSTYHTGIANAQQLSPARVGIIQGRPGTIVKNESVLVTVRSHNCAALVDALRNGRARA